MIRFAHISDIHINAHPLGWGVGDWFSKRATTWLNRRLGRDRRFRRADEVMATFARDRIERGIERVVFSGDASNLGLPNEFDRAATFLGVGVCPGLAVPGNHDYLTRAAESSGDFERRFAPWQQGERLDGHVYPFAQKAGEVWLVGVNSARGNRMFWDASGAVGLEQTNRLERLLAQLPPGPRILVTHYPIRLRNGQVEGRTHGLTDLPRVLKVAAQGGVRLWLHGHRHTFYVLPKPEGACFPSICIGSGTQEGLWSYGDYRIEAGRLSAVRRVYSPEANVFVDGEMFAFDL